MRTTCTITILVYNVELFLFDSGRLGVCGLCLFPLFRCSVVPSDSTSRSRSRSLRCVIRSALILTLILHSAIIDIGTPLPLPSLHSIVIPDQLHVFRISCFTGLEVFDLFSFGIMGGGGGGGD